MPLFIKPGGVRCRIAPSPTGNLHIGTARAALFNYLFAKKYGGKFILRIEDTDIERSDKVFEKNILEGLQWLGINADEGPEAGGPHAPYRQSERTASYKKYIKKLLDEGRAFYCFHSEQELKFEAKEQMSMKLPLFHLCSFRDMPQSEAETKKAAGQSAIIRFKIPTEPSNHQITFQDLIRNQVHFFTGLLGDFSIAKNLETPLYNFAVVVDDHEMAITHVIRGEDHIPNTPKQLLIAEALGWTTTNEFGDIVPPWRYAHLPLILGPDCSKLSKRHGATSVDEYREQGYLPEALFNFMALVGWNPGTDKEIFTKEELIQEFSIENVQKAGAIFDIQKLDWMNGEYIRRKPLSELAELTMPFLKESGLLQITNHKSQITNDYLKKVLALEQPRLKKLSEIGERTDYFFRAPAYNKGLLRWKDMNDEKVLAALKRAEEIIKLKVKSLKSKIEIEKIFLEEIGEGDKGEILWPLRVALTGKKASPSPFEIMEILGKEESLKKLKTATRKITG
ncbi:MAG: glutamate--tRNA ligase [Candidatus Sungbacteria bacterium RIFCSPLOWO2_12_FULL_41_11]|uniref:Glutamate--tRNA ligase n=1 Tax=Candidatus Sungbacteria bacterium RIFCSPLOWO2_12_FULL_41_11 TaxID=1802286 RepID=A0A1G2LU31_9BACT|nr:MAG: Glutamate-tRNA ligase [Parcubacteria group bacterium GW2011_GWA2_42_14]OHA00098.1 MAG: glutamate--tRNA ligase [Candidatus Sungbacteria bacterium RIFCSPHIGHO2_02_FULL_41_12b]OHA14382.1 MAG: glutamate--tRNA ligase [Candidatus Sungbacteria bacterium RIFCSPLOWO2_12_FULL_41_11]